MNTIGDNDDDDERSEEEETNDDYCNYDDDSYYGGSTVLNYDFNGRLEVKFDNTTTYQVDTIGKRLIFGLETMPIRCSRRRGFRNARFRLHTSSIY